jgi:hypothetical protein
MTANTSNSQIINFVRLLNGDDIISEVTNKTKTSLVLKNPMLLINNIELEEGIQTLFLYPWIAQGISLGNEIKLSLSNILFLTDIEPDILEHYNGIVKIAYDTKTKPKIVSSDAPKISDIGKNIINFKDASHKNKKDIH